MVLRAVMVLVGIVSVVGGAHAAGQQAIRLEAEKGKLTNVAVSTSRAGYSGSGYVTGFKNDADRVEFSFDAAGGLYEVRIRYSCPGGAKGYTLDVNGSRSSGMLEATGERFASASAGKVELKAGTNTISIYGGWHYYDIDAVELVPVGELPTVAKPPKTLADPQASAKARELMGRLVDLYGEKTLSGVTGLSDGELVRETTGQTPAILAEDLMEYSPSRIAHGSRPDGHAERVIEAAKRGYTISLSWHWNAPSGLIDADYVGADGRKVQAPWWFGFYTRATHFDVEKTLANPDSEDYKLLLRDMDAIAVQLKKLADADVPVLWRPLHEASGRWFWWGAKGPEAFKKLWVLMYERMTKHHGLHNLIWVYTGDADLKWYPGDEYVDVVGIDAYPDDRHETLSQLWDECQKSYGGKKLVAISEFGGVPDIPRMRRFGACWSYFVPWFGCVQGTPADERKAIFNDPAVVNQAVKVGR